MLSFLVSVVLVTASGALAPGPLFFANVSHGAKSGAKGGLAFSVGHTIFEASLVVLLAVTLQTVVDEPLIRLVVGAIGGTALIVFGLLQIRRGLKSATTLIGREESSSRNPLLLGTIFTGLNPYFLLWWLSAGMPLIMNALIIASFLGVLLMYIAHVWMDYAWLIGWAYLSKKVTNLLSRKGYRTVMKALMIVFGVVLVCFGLYFLVPSVWIILS